MIPALPVRLAVTLLVLGSLLGCAPLPDLGGPNPNPPPRPPLQPMADLLAVPAPEATAESAAALAQRGQALRSEAEAIQ